MGKRQGDGGHPRTDDFFPTNQECGLLTNNFNSRPVVMMSYNPDYYVDFINVANIASNKEEIHIGKVNLNDFDAEVEGKPVGVCISIPDINQALARINGRLFPREHLSYFGTGAK